MTLKFAQDNVLEKHLVIRVLRYIAIGADQQAELNEWEATVHVLGDICSLNLAYSPDAGKYNVMAAKCSETVRIVIAVDCGRMLLKLQEGVVKT